MFFIYPKLIAILCFYPEKFRKGKTLSQWGSKRHKFSHSISQNLNNIFLLISFNKSFRLYSVSQYFLFYFYSSFSPKTNELIYKR